MLTRRRCIAALAQLVMVPIAVPRGQERAAQRTTVTLIIEGMT